MSDSHEIHQEEVKSKKKEQNILGQLSKERGYGANLSRILENAAQKRRTTHLRVSEELKKKEKEENILAQFYKDIIFGANLPQIIEDAAKEEDSTPILVCVESLPKLENLAKYVDNQKRLLQKRTGLPHDDDHEIISKKMHTENTDLDFDQARNNSDEGLEEIQQRPIKKSEKISHDENILKKRKSGRDIARNPAIKDKLHQVAEVCGYSHWKSPTGYANWRKQPMWQEEFDLLYDTLTDEQKDDVNKLIELSYDPVYYLLTMKKGFYTYGEVLYNMKKGSPNLKKLFTNMDTYLASYASKISSKG